MRQLVWGGERNKPMKRKRHTHTNIARSLIAELSKTGREDDLLPPFFVVF